MKKNNSNLRNLAVFLSLLSVPISGLKAHTITFHSKKFSGVAETLMREHKEKAMYQIPLHNVEAYLPELHKIKREAVKLIADRYVPGKTALKVMRYFTYDSGGKTYSDNAKHFFSRLEENVPHTYVISANRLIFTESATNPALEKLKDIFTKHFLISGLQKKINYSGEFFVYKNKINGDVFVVFDNSSGTYKPPTGLLANVQHVLDSNLNSDSDDQEEKLYIITKSYDQKIDTAKLFEHEADPFLKGPQLMNNGGPCCV